MFALFPEKVVYYQITSDLLWLVAIHRRVLEEEWFEESAVAGPRSSCLDLVTHPLHAVAVPDLQLLLGPLEATVLLVIGRGLKVDVNIIGGLGSRRHGCRVRNRW